MELTVDALDKDYPTPSGPLPVLRGVRLSLEPGTAVAIMGPSGSGKSTLLQILGTLDRPSRGSVRLGGTDPFALGDAELARFRNRNVGFVFQDHHLLPQFSVLENVLLPAIPARDTSPELRAYASELLERVGLSARLSHRPAELSGGERQRAALARALVLKPKLLLADEPTGNLDRANAAAVADLLMDLHQREGAILIAVTHSADFAARFPRRFEMMDGTLQPAA